MHTHYLFSLGLKFQTFIFITSIQIILIVIIGPMFSGKTSELIRRIKRYQLAGKKTIIYKPSIDVRYSIENVNSHDGLKYPARIIPNDEKGIYILADEYKFMTLLE